MMNPSLFKDLFESFAELETAIRRAKDAVANEPGKSELDDRLSEYERMLASQKAFASKLYDHALKGDWSEVHRHVKIINHLSRMIRDDARAILSQKLPASELDKLSLQ